MLTILSGLGSKASSPSSIGEISIFLTGDERIEALNSAYRACNRPTDVLSFAQAADGGRFHPAPQSLGDIVISLDTADRQAKAAKCSVSEEVLRLLIHGILHLLGYEHESVPPARARLMRKKEDQIFRSVARPAPFLSRRH